MRHTLLEAAATPAWAPGLGVVKQSGGTLTADSGAGQGSTLVALLPGYDVNDYLL
jgi:hypothetical protein